MGTDPKTVDIYSAKAADYADRFDSGGDDPRLDQFIDTLPERAAVLDLGCGTGRAAAQMLARGLDVTALDASRGMADLAKGRFGVDVTVGTFDDITGENIYDGIWASFSLLHAPREDMPRHLAALRLALKPGGRLMVGLKTGTGTHRDALGRRYTYYEADELTGLLTDAGFSVETVETGAEKGLDGTLAPWVIVLADG